MAELKVKAEPVVEATSPATDYELFAVTAAPVEEQEDLLFTASSDDQEDVFDVEVDHLTPYEPQAGLSQPTGDVPQRPRSDARDCCPSCNFLRGHADNCPIEQKIGGTVLGADLHTPSTWNNFADYMEQRQTGVPPLEQPDAVYDSKIEKLWPEDECRHWTDNRTGKEVEWPDFGEDEREVVVATRQGRELQIYRCEEDETLQDVYDGFGIDTVPLHVFLDLQRLMNPVFSSSTDYQRAISRTYKEGTLFTIPVMWPCCAKHPGCSCPSL